MAVSHSFAGEHVEDGGGEEADADRDQHDIKHGDYLRIGFQIAGMRSIAAP
jgi:hypothetical protein